MSGHPLLKFRIYLIIVVHALLVVASWIGAWYLRLEDQFYDVIERLGGTRPQTPPVEPASRPGRIACLYPRKRW